MAKEGLGGGVVGGEETPLVTLYIYCRSGLFRNNKKNCSPMYSAIFDKLELNPGVGGKKPPPVSRKSPNLPNQSLLVSSFRFNQANHYLKVVNAVFL